MEPLNSAAAVGASVALFATYPLIRLARALDWQDAPGPSDHERKQQAQPVPVVGGAAILLGLFALGDSGPWVWPPLLAAFFVGLVDDLLPGGLRPGLKVAGQAGVGLVVAQSLFPGDMAQLLVCLVLVPLALNIWNTFDNADGAATGVGALCLFSLGSPAAAPLLGVLPWNLRPRGGAAAAARGPLPREKSSAQKHRVPGLNRRAQTAAAAAAAEEGRRRCLPRGLRQPPLGLPHHPPPRRLAAHGTPRHGPLACVHPPAPSGPAALAGRSEAPRSPPRGAGAFAPLRRALPVGCGRYQLCGPWLAGPGADGGRVLRARTGVPSLPRRRRAPIIFDPKSGLSRPKPR